MIAARVTAEWHPYDTRYNSRYNNSRSNISRSDSRMLPPYNALSHRIVWYVARFVAQNVPPMAVV